MIEKATSLFWKNLRGLGFIDSAQVTRWQSLANQPGTSWLQLCQTIQQESRLSASQLQSLTLEEPITPVQVGSLLIQMRTMHPLDWDAFDAVHVKLEQSWRVILLPQDDVDPSAQSVLQRARTVAGLNDPHVTSIVDLEAYGPRYAIVLPVGRGERLSQIWAKSGSRIHWQDLSIQLIATLRRVHANGIELGKLDPLILRYIDETQELFLDDLVVSPWINEDVVPNGLNTAEEAVVVAYRTHRARFLVEQGTSRVEYTKNLSSQDRAGGSASATDWLECAAWLDFVASRLTTSNSWAEPMSLAKQLQQAAIELCRIAEGSDAEFAKWYASWFESNIESSGSSHALPRAQQVRNPWHHAHEAAEISAADVVALSPEDADTTATVPDPVENPVTPVGVAEPTPSPDLVSRTDPFELTTAKNTNSKPRPASLAEKQIAKRQLENRRKIITAIAIVAPLPVCLMVLVLVYFAMPESNERPNRDYRSNNSELPTAHLPDLDLQPKSDSKNIAKESSAKQPPKAPEKSAKVTNEPSSNTESAPVDATIESDDELLVDLSPPRNKNNSTDTFERSTTAGAPIASDLPELTSDSTTADSPTSGPVDDDFVSYTHLASEMDVVGGWQDLLNGAAKVSSSRTVQLGRINQVTAKETLLEIANGQSRASNAYRLVSKPSEDRSIVQQWELQTAAGDPPKPLALVQTTASGHLQLVLAPTPSDDWNEAKDLQIELHYQEHAISHLIHLGTGSRPAFTELSEQPGQLPTDTTTATTTEVEPVTPVPSGDGPPNDRKPTVDEAKPSAVDSAAETILDLPFDPKSAASKPWFKDTPGFPREGVEWRFQLLGQPLRKIEIEKEHPIWKALRVRTKEDAYFMDDVLDAGSVVLVVEAETGQRTKLKGRLHLLTPDGAIELKKDSAADAATAAEQFKQTMVLQHQQLKAIRAKPGEGDRKQAEMNRLDVMMKEMDRYKKALEPIIENNDALLEKGLAFGLVQVMDGQEQYLLKSQGYQDPSPPNE